MHFVHSPVHSAPMFLPRRFLTSMRAVGKNGSSNSGSSGENVMSPVSNNVNPLLQALVKSNLLPAERLSLPQKPAVHSPTSFPKLLSSASTLEMAADLQLSGFTPAQSFAILSSIQLILSQKMSTLSEELYSSSQVAADTELLKSVYHELKLDLLSRTTKSSLDFKTLHEKHALDCQSFAETLRELATLLKTDSLMYLNAYKADNRSETQKIDLMLHQHTADLTTAMGDFRTTVESVKLKTMSTFTISLLVIFFAVLAERAYSKEKERERKELQRKTAFDMEQQWPKT